MTRSNRAARRSDARVRRRRGRVICSARRGSCRRNTSTTRSARRCSTPSAGCRGIASRAPSRRCSPATRSDIVAPLQRPLTLVELGCGSGDKLARARRRRAGERSRRFSWSTSRAAALDMARRRLAGARRSVRHRGAPGDLRRGSGRARSRARAAPVDAGAVPRLEHRQLRPGRRATSFCAASAASLRAGDALLLGSDLVKPEGELLLAYDDPLQVTAAFNRNLLRRINDELGGTSISTGSRIARCGTRRASRVEMHLVSRRRQHVRIAARRSRDHVRRRAKRSGPRARTSTEPEQVARGWLRRRLRCPPNSGSTKRPRFALTRFSISA